jgi:hypothetical protein
MTATTERREYLVTTNAAGEDLYEARFVRIPEWYARRLRAQGFAVVPAEEVEGR